MAEKELTIPPYKPGSAPTWEETPQDKAKSDKQEKRQKAMEKEVYGPKAPPVKKAKGGTVSASKRADGIAQRGKTRGKIV